MRFVQLGQVRDEHHARVAATGEEDAIGVDPQLKRVAHHGLALVSAGLRVRPAATLHHQVRTPRQQRGVQLEALSTELGDARVEPAAAPARVGVFRIPVPRSDSDPLRRLEVVGNPELRKVAVLRSGDDAEPGVAVVGVAIAQVVLGHVERTREAQVEAVGLEPIGEIAERPRGLGIQEASHEAVKVTGEVEAELGVEV
jgi:hypothetical protein